MVKGCIRLSVGFGLPRLPIAPCAADKAQSLKRSISPQSATCTEKEGDDVAADVAAIKTPAAKKLRQKPAPLQ
jgi:hypothetical protein